MKYIIFLNVALVVIYLLMFFLLVYGFILFEKNKKGKLTNNKALELWRYGGKLNNKYFIIKFSYFVGIFISSVLLFEVIITKEFKLNGIVYGSLNSSPINYYLIVIILIYLLIFNIKKLFLSKKEVLKNSK